MNLAAFASLPASACTLGGAGSQGADRIKRYSYDPAGRVTKVQTGYGMSVQADELTRSFSLNGLALSATDARGNRTAFDYDGHDRPLRTFYPSPTSPGTSSATDFEQFAYDGNGNLISRRRRDGLMIGYGFDNMNRLISKDLPGAEPDASFGYDIRGRRAQAVQGGQTLSWAYDPLGQLLSATGPLGTVSYLYDEAGRRARMTWPDGFRIDYSYLPTGDLSTIKDSSGAVLAAFNYDALGRRSSVTRLNGTTTSFAYDPVSRLSALTDTLSGGRSASFTYNPASQIASRQLSPDSHAWTGAYNVSRPYSVNGLNQYTLAGTIVPTYDGRGNLTSAGATTYSYDSENRLTGASGGISLAYDPAGRLHQVAGTSTKRMLYDGADRIAEYDGSGALLRRFVHGPGTDELLLWYEGATRHWLHADERGSIVAVTNNEGAVVGINAYDEFGIPATPVAGSFAYTGQAWVPELGLSYYKARFYSPTLGRFLQTDPIGYGDGMNLYAYVGNVPVNRVDPSGQSGKLVGVVVQVGRRGVRDGIRDTIRETRNAWNALRSDAPTSTGTKLRATVELIAGIPLYTEGRSDEERSAEGRHIITEGQEPDGIQIDNRGEGRNVTNVLEEAANVAGVPVGETRDGKPTVVFPDGSRATGYPESRTTGAPVSEFVDQGSA